MELWKLQREVAHVSDYVTRVDRSHSPRIGKLEDALAKLTVKVDDAIASNTEAIERMAINAEAWEVGIMARVERLEQYGVLPELIDIDMDPPTTKGI